MCVLKVDLSGEQKKSDADLPPVYPAPMDGRNKLGTKPVGFRSSNRIMLTPHLRGEHVGPQ